MAAVYVAKVLVDGLGWVVIAEEFATRSQADMRALAFAIKWDGKETRVTEVPIGAKQEVTA